MNRPSQELGDRGSPLALASSLVLASGATGRARDRKPRPSGRRAPHRAPAHTRVRTLVLPNKEPQP